MLAGFDIPWLALAYAAAASICLTLVVMHLFLWARLEGVTSYAYLMFAVIATAAAATGAVEFLLTQITTIEGYARLLRLAHVPIGLFVLMIPWFVRVLFGTGRTWLALASNAVTVAALAVNFLSPYSRLYARITDIERIPIFDGELFTVVTGVPHPWRWVGHVAMILILAFVIDASVSLWRRGDRRRALVIGASAMLTLVFTFGLSELTGYGVVRMPYVISFAFVLLSAGMAFLLLDDAWRASALGQQVLAQEETLHEQEERLWLATNAADIGIWSWNAGQEDIWMTPRALALLDLEANATLTWSGALDLVHPADRQQVLEEAQRLRVTGGEFGGECRLIRTDSSVQWVFASGRASLMNGDTLQATGVVLDITERKNAEAELEMQRAEVAHLSRMTILGEMSGSIVHELSQPLTAIRSNAQAALRFLAQEPADLGEVHQALLDIVTQNRYSTEVIERLRLLLRKGERRSEQVNLSTLVAEVLRLARDGLARQDIDVTTELVPTLPAILGDEVLLHQVLLNLVLNGAEAMKDTEPGERRLVVRTQVQDGGVEITVVDRGQGIPATDMERIFQPFFTTRRGGTGLGLAVCRTIMSAHGGRIWASPGDEGRGARVHVLLPTDGKSIA